MSEMPMAELLQFDLQDRLAKSLRVGGVGVAEMSSYLDVNRNTVGNYLSGRTRPSRATLVAWALRTGVPVTWLETGQAPVDGPEPGGAVRHQGLEPRTR